jgi:hypothetical protein
MKITAWMTAGAAIVALAACGSSHHGTAVPSLPGSGGGAAAAAGNGNAAPSSGASGSAMSRPRVGYSATRVAQLHAAAQCIRTHGVPSYQDPVLTPDGYVYTDSRSIQDLGRDQSDAQQNAMLNAIRQACGTLFTAAGLQPDDESPAPPQMVQAGVRAARCLRANGLPNYRDPTSQSEFTPGHGFGMTNDELPNNGRLGKTDPTVQRAFTACRPLLDAEIAASTLQNLGHD